MNKHIQFGTDGIRGKADAFPFTPAAQVTLGRAIAQWSKTKYAKSHPHVLIGHDTRKSCKTIKQSLEQGLTHAHARITDGGVLPTPAVLQLMRHNNAFDFGIVISASHNAYTDNGLKIFDAKSGKLTHADEKLIITLFAEHYTPNTQTDIETNLTHWTEASAVYERAIISFFKPVYLAGKKIVLDCAHGATAHIAPHLFKHFGAQVITHATAPTGTNINHNCGTLHPEILQKLVIDRQADIGFAFDGDGDRVIAVNKYGTIKDGDDLLAILLNAPEFRSSSSVIGTVMTNYGFEQYLHQKNKALIRTPVGDKYVVAQMEAHNTLLGGEKSGHIIIKNYLNTGDGIFVALKTLEAIVATQNWDMKTFSHTPQVLVNVPVDKKKELEKQPYKTIIDQQKALLQNGRTVVRYSGTENLLRVMVEDSTKESATQVAHTLAEQLQCALLN